MMKKLVLFSVLFLSIILSFACSKKVKGGNGDTPSSKFPARMDITDAEQLLSTVLEVTSGSEIRQAGLLYKTPSSHSRDQDKMAIPVNFLDNNGKPVSTPFYVQEMAKIDDDYLLVNITETPGIEPFYMFIVEKQTGILTHVLGDYVFYRKNFSTSELELSISTDKNYNLYITGKDKNLYRIEYKKSKTAIPVFEGTNILYDAKVLNNGNIVGYTDPNYHLGTINVEGCMAVKKTTHSRYYCLKFPENVLLSRSRWPSEIFEYQDDIFIFGDVLVGQLRNAKLQKNLYRISHDINSDQTITLEPEIEQFEAVGSIRFYPTDQDLYAVSFGGSVLQTECPAFRYVLRKNQDGDKLIIVDNETKKLTYEYFSKPSYYTEAFPWLYSKLFNTDHDLTRVNILTGIDESFIIEDIATISAVSDGSFSVSVYYNYEPSKIYNYDSSGTLMTEVTKVALEENYKPNQLISLSSTITNKKAH